MYLSVSYVKNSHIKEVIQVLFLQRKYPMHYKIALIINYLGHCISVGALVVAFILFLCLRQVQK